MSLEAHSRKNHDISIVSLALRVSTEVAEAKPKATKVLAWIFCEASCDSFLGAHSMGQTLEFDGSIMVFGVFSNALYIDYISFYASKWYPNGA